MTRTSPILRGGLVLPTMVMLLAAPLALAAPPAHSPINGPGPGNWACSIDSSGDLVCTNGNKTWRESTNDGEPGQCVATLNQGGRTIAIGTGPCISFGGLKPISLLDLPYNYSKKTAN